MNPETSKLSAWHEKEREKGLLDIKFFTSNLSNTTTENFSRDVNLITSSEYNESTEFNDNVERHPASQVLPMLLKL